METKFTCTEAENDYIKVEPGSDGGVRFTLSDGPSYGEVWLNNSDARDFAGAILALLDEATDPEPVYALPNAENLAVGNIVTLDYRKLDGGHRFFDQVEVESRYTTHAGDRIVVVKYDDEIRGLRADRIERLRVESRG